jgi:hypothetical protein
MILGHHIYEFKGVEKTGLDLHISEFIGVEKFGLRLHISEIIGVEKFGIPFTDPLRDLNTTVINYSMPKPYSPTKGLTNSHFKDYKFFLAI